MLERAEPKASAPGERRWLALAVIALAQLMIALDATIVSIALPSAQQALRASNADRQWVLTAYTLAFGGLLLTGGRVSDMLGRRRAFVMGLSGFALVSAIGGTAPSIDVLLFARGLQGAFAALLAPTALSLLAVTFREPKERATAFAVYGAIAGTGGALGLLFGGALTQSVGWRWCLYVNLPISLVAAVAGFRILPRSGSSRASLDIPGAVLATGALAALVYACSQAVSMGWTSSPVVVGLVVSVILAAGFVVRERLAATPLLPMSIVMNRNRGGAYLSAALAIGSMFGAFLFLTYYFQQVLHYTPLAAGFAFLPLSLASQAGSWGIARVLMPRLAARWIMVSGALIAAAGMLALSAVGAHAVFLSSLFPAEVLLGVGIACLMSPAFSVATLGVDRRFAGVAAGTINAAVQVGASIGTAVLNATLAHGYSTTALVAAILLLLAGMVAAVLVTASPQATRG